MTKYVAAAAYGGPEVLALEEESLPDPGPGEALIDVRAAGVNPYDWKSYSGMFGTNPDRLPMRVGSEAAGTVVAVGPDAVGQGGPVSVGDDVIVFRASGAYAERLLAAGDRILPKPDNLTFEQSAGLMLTGTTAVHCLTATDVGPSDTVLIHAASGGVGLMAVQLAKARGARVLGTASERNHDLLRSLGAEPVVYGGDLERRVRDLSPDGVDAALDLIGTDEAIDVSLALVSDRDRIATIAGFQRGGEAGIKLLGGGPGADPGTEIRDAARMQLVAAASAGELQVFVAGTYPLTAVADAHRDLKESRHGNGKLILIP
jgi:NADPH:quinone reductase-like Zn-dependent oxidoreductase